MNRITNIGYLKAKKVKSDSVNSGNALDTSSQTEFIEESVSISKMLFRRNETGCFENRSVDDLRKMTVDYIKSRSDRSAISAAKAFSFAMENCGKAITTAQTVKLPDKTEVSPLEAKVASAALERGLAARKSGDSHTAFQEYKLAAVNGNYRAMHMLGDAFYMGRGTTRDVSSAILWFERATMGGSPQTFANLVSIYSQPGSRAYDPFNAYKWSLLWRDEKGIEGGRNQPVKALQGMAATSLSKEKIEEAKQFAKQFIQKYSGQKSAKGKETESKFEYQPPKDLVLATESKKENLIMQEWIPPGETVHNWTRMATLQVFPERLVHPEVFRLGMMALGKKDCGTYEGSTETERASNGFPSVIFTGACPLFPKSGKAEFTLYKAIQGPHALIVMQMAWRGDKLPVDQRPVSDDEFNNWMTHINSAKICVRFDPKHPC